VLIHGVASSPDVWRRNVAALAARHRVYLVDLFAVRARTFSLDATAERLAAWVATLPDGPAILIGHSMGGYLAAWIAATRPTAVSRLVLVNASALPSTLGLASRAMGLLREQRRDDAETRILVAAGMRQSGRLRCWHTALQALGADLSGRLTQIRVPTLVIWGGQDGVVPIDVGQRLARSIHGAQLTVMTDAGHMPMWEDPGTFNAVLKTFLEEPGYSSAPAQLDGSSSAGPMAASRRAASLRAASAPAASAATKRNGSPGIRWPTMRRSASMTTPITG
jgi:pimeloyl-ACP methyl ester carboxylesterase